MDFGEQLIDNGLHWKEFNLLVLAILQLTLDVNLLIQDF